MASLTAKVVHGHKYFQIITSRRINGKPAKSSWPTSAPPIPSSPASNRSRASPSRRASNRSASSPRPGAWHKSFNSSPSSTGTFPNVSKGASVGQYLVLAALNRLTSPNSKARMAQWYRKTPLQRWLPLSAKQLRSQRFWDAMNAVDESAIRKIEMQLSRQLVEDFGIDVRCLCFDCTNFDTFR